MNSGHLIESLQRIGYPKADDLDPQALEWVFENRSTLPFLEWFCTSIGEENVLSSEQLEEYKKIQESGDVVSGPQLEEALQALAKEESNSDDLGDDVEKLKEAVARVKAKKSTLMMRCNKLSVHHLALRNKVTRMEEVEALNLKSCQQAGDQCSAQDAKVAEALTKLLASVKSISALYQTDSSSTAGGENGNHFLSQLDLKAFHDAEEKFSRDLTSFTKKQFFEGLAELAGEREVSEYGLLDVTSPSKVSFEGKDKAVFEEDCQEFARLQQIFPKSECDRINALVSAKKALSAVQEAKSILHSLKSGQFPTSAADVSRLQHPIEQNIEAAKTQAEPLLSSLPDLLKELGGLQGTEILTGDYDLKLKRQDYFTRSQDAVIGHLVEQRARNEFLTMLYDLEVRCHRETHHLLTAARRVLETQLEDWQQRMKDLDDPDLCVKKFERSVVDTRDTSTARLYDLLGESEEEEKMLYLLKQRVLDKAKNLHSQHNSVKVLDQTMDEKYLTKVDQLESSVKECESTIYAGSTTSSGQPVLSPLEIQSAMATLSAQLSTLETEIATVISDVNTKKTALKNNVLQNKERELFILFHTNASRLQYVVNGLADRLKAQDIK